MKYSAKIYYFEEDKTSILRDCIFPLVLHAEARGWLINPYIQTHWHLGPHIRVIFERGQVVTQYEIEEIFTEAVQSYLEENPSSQMIDEENYELKSKRLGSLELQKGPFLPLASNNSICIQPYEENNYLLPTSAQRQLKAQILSDVLPLQHQMLKQSKSQRMVSLFMWMVELCNIYPNGGVKRGQLSLRSHLEDFLHDTNKGEMLRSLFAKSLQNDYDKFNTLFLAILEGELVQDESVRIWKQSLLRWWDQARKASEKGELLEENERISELADQVDDKAKLKWNFEERSFSEFHQELRKENKSSARRYDTKNFAAYRFIVNLFYLILPVLQVTPMERYYFCYVISALTEEYYQMDWKEIFTEEGKKEKERSRQ